MLPGRFFLLCSTLTIGMAGCAGGDGLPRESISGTVTVDGIPLDSGTITFMPADQAAAQSSGQSTITAGAYTISAGEGLVPGSYRVSISSPVPVESAEVRRGGADFEDIGGTGAEEAESEVPLREAVPRRYNSDSTLTAQVTADGPNTFDFPLESE